MTSPTAQFTERLAAVTALHAATTSGPWFWWGNTDTHDISLAGRDAHGVTAVITTTGVERDPDGPDAQRMRASMADCGSDPDQIDAYIETWAEDEHGGPRQDERLALGGPSGYLQTVEEVAVYAVARSQGLPDDTPRSDRRIYRADICDVRGNPNGEFLACSWAEVKWMSEALARVAALVSEKPASRRDERGYFCGLESMPEGSHRTTGGRASCADCLQWCYEHAPCACCWAPVDPAELVAALTGEPIELPVPVTHGRADPPVA